MSLRHPALTALACLLLAACASGPDYVRPPLALPAAFGEAPAGWKTAEPGEIADDGRWWRRYGDPGLDALVERIEIGNQNIAAAAAQYRQASALAGSAEAALWPTLGAGAAYTRSLGSSTAEPPASLPPVRNRDRATLASSWEIDLWGRLRRGAEAGQENAAAAAADLAAARLSARAALVQAYLQLRINDAQRRLLDDTLVAYRRSHAITRQRYAAGVAPQAEVAQAEAQWRTTEAQAIDLGAQRSQLEHAIAVLLGEAPAAFRLPAVATLPELPALPPTLPSALLERRPDVAAAERRVAAANAQIGVARTAYFPSLNLGGSAGLQGASQFAELFALPYRFWSVGPALALTLFDGGARAAAGAQAVAAYERSVAAYRQSVLGALQEVEDNLSSLRVLGEEADVQALAVRAANDFQRLTNNQYLAGSVSFLNVATAQAAALTAERSALDLRGRRLQASLGLLRALGGDWQENAAAAAGRATTP